MGCQSVSISSPLTREPSTESPPPPLLVGLTLVIGLSQGGISAILYGLIFLLFFNGILGCCLAEMASAMPSAGGQVRFSLHCRRERKD